MITTTTVTTTAIASGLLGSLALMAILFFVGLLVAKEIAATLPSERARRLSRALNVALVPLSIIFAAALVFQLVAVFG